MKYQIVSLLSGIALVACGEAPSQQSAGVTISAIAANTPAGADNIVVYILSGDVSCPELGSFHDGRAFASDGSDLGSGQMAALRQERAANGNGGNQLTNDVFFDDVQVGTFTVCARPANFYGVCQNACDTARAVGSAQLAHKTHVELAMTCHTPGTADVGAVVKIQNTPSINVKNAVEVGLASCGSALDADVLSVTGIIESPDGTDSFFQADIDGTYPPNVKLTPGAGAWSSTDSNGGFEILAENNTGGAITIPLRIRARTVGLDGTLLYADEYTLALEWLDCQ